MTSTGEVVVMGKYIMREYKTDIYEVDISNNYNYAHNHNYDMVNPTLINVDKVSSYEKIFSVDKGNITLTKDDFIFIDGKNYNIESVSMDDKGRTIYIIDKVLWIKDDIDSYTQAKLALSEWRNEWENENLR